METDRPFSVSTASEERRLRTSQRLLRARSDLRDVVFCNESLESELAQANLRADRAEAELTAVLNSRTWRVTSPARKFVRGLVRIYSSLTSSLTSTSDVPLGQSARARYRNGQEGIR